MNQTQNPKLVINGGDSKQQQHQMPPHNHVSTF